ncbi:MAG: TRAP transporter large permease [Granulosicoccus sp.]|nr:TRAP transporter large permease [Granulosicoccus sp.]
MTPIEIGFAMTACAIALIVAGLYVSIALMLCSFFGVWLVKGSALLAGKMLALTTSDAIASYHFGVIPMYVLLGCIVAMSGMGRDIYEVANQIFRRLIGGLGISTVAANALFAAVSGISVASAAIFSSIAVPEMKRHGYQPRFAAGIVAGSSVLGMLIPPSLLMILYAVLAEQSLGDLFIAGILPGILLALSLMMSVILMVKMFPGFTGHTLSVPQERTLDARAMVARTLPIFSLVCIVLGGIYGGVFTPLEASAVGCLVALIIAACRGSVTVVGLQRALIDAGNITASICFLIIASRMYARMLAITGIQSELSGMIDSVGLHFWALMVVYVALLIVIGMILDSASVLLIVVPLALPVVSSMPVDLVWFGVVTVIAVEIGLLTPPFGLSVYAIHGSLNDSDLSLLDIFMGAAPFILSILLVLVLVLMFPILSIGWLAN